MSTYVEFVAGQLGTALTEDGQVYPLLRKVGGSSEYVWALAIKKVANNDNCILAALLQALGFVWDENQTDGGNTFTGFDFFHLPEADGLIKPLDGGFFSNLPTSTGAIFEVLPPTTSPLQLTAANPTIETNVVPFGISSFEVFDPKAELLGGRNGSEIRPQFDLDVRLKDEGSLTGNDGKQGHAQREYRTVPLPTGDVFLALNGQSAEYIHISQRPDTGIVGVIQANGADFHAATALNLVANNEKLNGKDTLRKSRLSLTSSALTFELDRRAMRQAKRTRLGIELFAGVRFEPAKGLPLTITVAGDMVAAHFQRLSNESTASSFDVRFRPGRLCLRVTVSGPLIQFGMESSDWPTLVESAEERVNDQLEKVNDAMTYSFQLCLPVEPTLFSPKAIDELIDFPWLNWQQKVPRLDDFFQRIKDLRLEIQNTIDADFDVTFPSVGKPPAFPGFKLGSEISFEKLPDPDAPDLRFPTFKILHPISGFAITPPRVPGIKAEEPQIDFGRLKLNFRYGIDLPGVAGFDYSELIITFANQPWPDKTFFPEIGDLLEIHHNGVRLPDLKIVEIVSPNAPLKFKLNAKLVGKIGEKPTFSELTVKWRRPSLEYSRRIRFIGCTDPKLFEPPYDIYLEGPEFPLIDGKFVIPELGPIDKVNEHLQCDISSDLTLPLMQSLLKDLLGDLPGVDFRIALPDVAFLRKGFKYGKLLIDPDKPDIKLPLPFELSLRIPRPGVEMPKAPKLRLWLSVGMNPTTMRLVSNRIYFYFPQMEAPEDAAKPKPSQQVIDFDLFTQSFPLRTEITAPPSEESHDGYLDLSLREFVIALKYPDGQEPDPPPRIRSFFPGGMDERAVELGLEGIEALPATSPDKRRLQREYTRRFRMELQMLDPETWPQEPAAGHGLYFRFNPKGITFNALLVKTEVEIDTSGHEEGQESDESGLIKPFKLNPQDKQGDLVSRIVVIDSELREATVFAKCFVPGVENLLAIVQVSLKQKERGKLPDIIATLQLERPDETPISEFSIKLLELQLKRIEMGLIWHREEKDWDYKLIADGSIGFTSAAELIPDLEGLRTPTIQVIGLDLRKLNLRAISIPILLEKPARFEILNKQFAIELGDLTLGWEFEGGIPRPRLLACKLARFEYLNPGSLEVKISVGGLEIEFDPKMKARIRMPSQIGIEVTMGSGVKLGGEVGWVDTERVTSGIVVNVIERYFFASVTCNVQGFEFKGLLKWGDGLKFNHKREPNIVLYGEMGMDYPLFSGVVVKELGAGFGINNRLTALPPVPNADAIISRIDTIEPEKISAWSFVQENGQYLSIVLKTFLAGAQGEADVVQSYVAMLAFSFDTNLDAVIAGKLWLSASLKGVKENLTRPALVGALVLSPRQKKLEVVVESRPKPYIEENELLETLFNKGKLRFSFRLMPGLVDYYLEEVSYKDKLFGVDLEFRGSYRFAIFDRSVLLKSELSATGKIGAKLNAGPGGFDFSGNVSLGVGYGGLLSLKGAMAYAYLDAGANFSLSAWIEIPFSISISCCGKRWTKRWSIVFRGRAGSLELTLRGNIGFSDQEKGLLGIDAMVGINFPICGYRLNASGRWDVNGHIYDDVRSAVSAFEGRLEERIKQSSAAETRLKTLQTRGASAALHQPRGIAAALRGRLAAASAPESKLNGGLENWLQYSRKVDGTPDEFYYLLLPKSDERWLTPLRAQVTKVKFVPAPSPRFAPFSGELIRDFATSLIPAMAGFTAPAPRDNAPKFQPTSIRKISPTQWRVKDDGLGTVRYLHNRGTVLDEQFPPTIVVIAPQHGIEHPRMSVADTNTYLPLLNAVGDDGSSPAGFVAAVNILGFNFRSNAKVTILQAGRYWRLSDAPDVKPQTTPVSIFHNLDDNRLEVCPELELGLAGIRSETDAALAASFNGFGKLRRVVDENTFELEPEHPPKLTETKDFEDLAAATWFERHTEYEKLPNRADFEEIPNLVDDVERLVIATGKTWDIAQADLTADNPPQLKLELATAITGLQIGSRLLLLDGTGKARDCGWACGAESALDATLLVLGTDGGTDSILVTQPVVMPAAGWKVIEAKEVATFWNARNRAAALGKLSDPESGRLVGTDELTQLIDDSALFVESALGSQIKDEFLPGYANYKVVFDPRLESTDRHWMTLQDQFLLPDHILSTQFRAVDENPDASATEVLQIREYLAARDQLRRNSMHKGSDPEPAEEAHQVRSRVAHAIIDDLSSRDGVSAFGEKFELPNGASVDSKLVLGLAFKLSKPSVGDPIRDLDGKVYIRRKRGELELNPIEISQPDSAKDEKLTSQIARLPIRQQFSVDHVPQTEQEVEKGRIVVKLPLRLSEGLLRGGVGKLGLERLGRIQILRKLPWEEKPSILRDHVRVDINTVDLPEKASLVLADCEAIFTSPNQLTAERSENINQTHVGFYLRFKKPADANTYLITSIDNQGGKTIIGIRVEKKNPIRISSGESMVFDIFSAGALVQSPYVFTDEFAVENRRLSDPALLPGGLPADQITIQYSLRIVPHDEPGEAVGDIAEQRDLGRYADWEAVSLHIPEPDTFPRQLAVAIAAESLVLDNRPFLDFQLVTLAGESPALALLDGRPLQARDVEIWALEKPLELTGFFAGDEPLTEVNRAVDNSKIKLTDLQNEAAFESRLGKFRVPVVPNGESLRLPSSLFHVAKGYRLYIRPAGRGDFTLLAPLDHLIVRNLPNVWDGSMRYRTEDRLEFFERDTWNEVGRHKVKLLAYQEFSADDLFQEGHNALRALWNNPRLLDGGAEVVIRDFDDSGFVERQLCEVLEEDRFRDSRSDFGNASYWRLERGLSRERLAGRSLDAELPHDKDGLFEYFFLNHEDLRNHPLIRPMETAFNKFMEGDLKWTDLAERSTNLVAALLQYRKSPLNLRIPLVEQTIDAIVRTLRAAAIGFQPPALTAEGPAKYAEKLRTRDTEIRKLLQSAEQAAMGDMPTDERGFATFLDRDTARRLAGIVRRRIAVAEEVVSLIDGQDSGSLDLTAESKELLAREYEWARIATAAKASFPNLEAQQEYLPVTKSFTDQFAPDNVEPAKQTVKTLFTQLRALVGFTEDPAASVPAKQKIARLLPRAAGLSQFLDLLAESIDAGGRGKIIKRPHHSLGIAPNKTGEIVAQETLLARFLPDSARGQSDQELPPPPRPAHRELPFRVGRLATLNGDGIARIWSADGGSPEVNRLKRLHEIQVFSAVGAGDTIELKAADERQWLLSHRGEQPAELWNVFTGERLFRLEPRIARVGDPKFKTTAAKLIVTHRGAQVATLDNSIDGAIADRDVIRLWDADTKNVSAMLRRKTVLLQGGTSLIKAAFGKNELVWRTDGSWLADGFVTGKDVVVSGDALGGASRTYSVTSVTPLALKLSVLAAVDDKALDGQASAATLQVTFNKSAKSITRTSGNWTTEGFEIGQTLLVSKAAGGTAGDPDNSGVYEISGVSSTTINVKQAVDDQTADYSFASFKNLDEFSTAKLEQPKDPLDFTKRKCTCFVYDDDSNTACAGTAEGQIVVWRYLGKGDQFNASFIDREGKLTDALQLRIGRTDVTAPVMRMLLVHGPEGLRVLAEAGDRLFVVDPLDKAPLMPLPVLKPGNGRPADDLPGITALALDAVNLRVFAGTTHGDIRVLDWSSKSWRTEPISVPDAPADTPSVDAVPAAAIAVLRSQEISWLVVGFGTQRPTQIFRLREHRRAAWTLEPVQSLPDGGETTSLHAAVMPAAASTTAGSVNAAFHVWERMGFALDFAIADPLNQLFKRGELQEIVHRVCRQLDEIDASLDRAAKEKERKDEDKLTLFRPVISGEPHYLFTLEPREPDSSYQPNNIVGHNFINVAVVPRRFHELCLTTEPNVVCPALLRNIPPAEGTLKPGGFGLDGRVIVFTATFSLEPYVEGMSLQVAPQNAPNDVTDVEILRLFKGEDGMPRIVVKKVTGVELPSDERTVNITGRSVLEATCDRTDIGDPEQDKPVVFVLSGPQRGFKSSVKWVANRRSGTRRAQRVVLQVEVERPENNENKLWDPAPGPTQDPSLVAFVREETYQRYEHLLNWLDFRSLKAFGGVGDISARTIIELLHLREVFRYLGAADGLRQQGTLPSDADPSKNTEFQRDATFSARALRAIRRTTGSWTEDGVVVNGKVKLSGDGFAAVDLDVDSIQAPNVLVLKGNDAWTASPTNPVVTPDGGVAIFGVAAQFEFGDRVERVLTQTGDWFNDGFLVGGLLTLHHAAADDDLWEIQAADTTTLLLQTAFVASSDRSTLPAAETVTAGRLIGNFASSRTRAACDLAVEPQAERWLTLPSVAGWSHTAWTTPDRKGHRFEVAIRRVSRYEPLIRWALIDHTPCDVKPDSVLYDDQVAATDGRTYVQLQEAIPSRLLHKHPLFLEIANGDGAGQRRRIEADKSDRKLALIDPADPLLVPVKANASQYRVIAHGDNWQFLEMPPILDPYQDEGDQALTVYQFPHPRQIQYTYQLPLQAARSLYNQISQIRTGYRGTDHSFRYLICDRPKSDPQCLDNVLACVVGVAESLDPRPFLMRTREANGEARIRLLRHERLLTLPDMPYYYRYRLDVRSLFESRPVERDQLFESELLPSDPNLSPLGERQPSRFKILQPLLTLPYVNIVSGTCLDSDPGSDPSKVKLQLNAAFDLTKYLADHDLTGTRVQLIATKTGTGSITCDIKAETWIGSGVTETISTERSVTIVATLDAPAVANVSTSITLTNPDVFADFTPPFELHLETEKVTVDVKQGPLFTLHAATTEDHAKGALAVLRPNHEWTFELTLHVYDLEVFLPTNDDHLSLDEKHSEPDKLRKRFTPLLPGDASTPLNASLDLHAGRLPDVSTGYQVLTRYSGVSSAEADVEPFIEAITLALPWSARFQPEKTDSRCVPLVSVTKDTLRIYCADLFHRQEVEDEHGVEIDLKEIVKLHTGRDETGLLTQALLVTIQNLGDVDSVCWWDGAQWSELNGAHTFGASGDHVVRPETIRLKFSRTSAVRVNIDKTLLQFPTRASVPIEALSANSTRDDDHEQIDYRVRFRVAVLKVGEAFNDPTRYFLHGQRDGDCTKTIQFEV